MIDIITEIKFKTARSGGKGGQNVNKVETMVEGYFHPGNSLLLTAEQKERIYSKLRNKINAEGILQVRSQEHRSQLANKLEVIKKMNALIAGALHKDKKRVPTRPSRSAKEKRIETKKNNAVIKEGRRKVRL
jgi:ribosome-associated protein